MIPNIRDALTGSSGPEGRLYRAGLLEDADVPRLSKLLTGGQTIDLRTMGRMRSNPDPTLTGIARVEIPLPPTAYVPYLNILEDHKQDLRAILLTATLRTPTLIHCTEGKDRTGIVIGLIMLAAGYSMYDTTLEFLRTPKAPLGHWESLNLTPRRVRQLLGRPLTKDLARVYGRHSGSGSGSGSSGQRSSG